MKTKNNLIKTLTLSSTLAITLAVGAWFPVHARAAEQVKGAQKLMELNRITTPAEAASLKPGDTLAMACAKCQTITVRNVTREKGHIDVMSVGSKHLCSGCSSTIEVVGRGKQAKDTVKHVCNSCGDQSVFCCATKPGSVTKGMEKK